MKRTQVQIDNEDILKNWDKFLEKSKNNCWFISMANMKAPLSQKLVNAILKAKNKKILVLDSYFPEDILKIQPYSVYVRSFRDYDESISIIKAAEEVNAKVISSLDFTRASATENEDYYIKTQKENNSIIYCVINDSKEWADIVTIVKKFKNINLDNIIFYDLPPCLATKWNVQYLPRKIAETSEQITSFDGLEDLSKILIKNYKKLKSNSDCKNFNSCFGIAKTNPSKCDPTLKSFNKPTSLMELTQKNMGIDYAIKKANPRKALENFELCEAMNILQDCRLNHHLGHKNFFYIWDWSESIFFNRPLEKTDLWKEDPRGLMSMNWIFLSRDNPSLLWKHKCDLVLPEHGFVTSAKIKFTSEWTKEKQVQLNNFTLSTIKDIILENGGNENNIDLIGNDLYYNGKKFAGKEWGYFPDIGYIENTVVTCDANAERKWLDMLYHHPKEHLITGITNELPTITKDFLIKEFYKKIDEFFRRF